MSLNTNLGTHILTGQAGFWGGATAAAYAHVPGVSFLALAGSNVVKTWQFILPFSITVNRAGTIVNLVRVAGSHFNAGVYSGDGNTKLIDVVFDGSLSTVQFVTLGTPVSLSPGVYFFAYSSTASTIQMSGFTGLSGNAPNLAGVFNQNFTRYGTAANSTSGNVMPATLGAITPAGASNFGVPAIWFES